MNNCLKRTALVCLTLFCMQPLWAQKTTSPKTNIRKWASELLNGAALEHAHVGICIYDPGKQEYWYQYQDDKYFTPASNTKIFTLFSGFQLLGDSLPALKYLETDSVLYVKGMGDPSFLHPEYTSQPAMDMLSRTDKRIVLVPAVVTNKRFGPGWGWSDYADYYQPELNEWPVYGNVARIRRHRDTISITPPVFADTAHFTVQEIDTLKEAVTDRDERSNHFSLQYARRDNELLEAEVPFITGNIQDLAQRLQDTLHKPVTVASPTTVLSPAAFKVLYSRPVDSLYTPMMHRSDNFYAEQTLMMCGARLWDSISTSSTIRYMQEHYLSFLPHPPQWVDGSGLSRYDLFTPRDFVSVLTAMRQQIPQERLWEIFPTGGKGTLRNYYQQQFVHAKTGTLNGCVALSGYLVTKKGKTLVFSVLVNNHNTTSTNVRRAVERFLTEIWDKN
ncbi:D-alanyl-D-alanine carboxypeptidase/D-alanyl-D-alanine-endopeptidase [Chitinophaga agrisoli]|uniref:D-alanyl-D-alanine carboxypeptidase/D-alanyl-D-alanine-endopeptidase n=2 Tax=Chitinophaga agrisoli TaxID=2607653 RepID=A0A5B2W3P8_9BACT|nr:D-alanyl-D-alanine carboxypeptidase/D-alanyl-D-alanine-endopeptidase [Chitinophaga agrisoli]